MVYLNQYQLLPYQRVEEFFQDIFSHPLSEGTLVNTNEEMYRALRESEEQIKTSLKFSKLLHADETGIRVNKELNWLHVASHPRLTYYGFHKKRGAEGMNDFGILPYFRGTLVHDHLKSYFQYGKNHGLCNAHHLRELTSIQDRFGCKWATDMEVLLLDIKKAVEDHYAATREALPIDIQKKWYRKYQNLVRRARTESPRVEDPNKKGRTKQNDAVNLLTRFRTFWRDVLRFMSDPTVPFDNNQAERDIRMTKVRQKISGCFRSSKGAHIFCRIRGYISSSKKQNLHILSALHAAMASLPIPLEF
jgi:transposase